MSLPEPSQDVNADIDEEPVGNDGRAAEDPGAPAPLPRRGPPVQGHWAEKTGNSFQASNSFSRQEEKQGFMDPESQDYPPDPDEDAEYRYTPRSTAEYSRSSLPSEAPEFYEQEPVTLSRIEEVLVMEHGLREACRTLPITMASWVFFILLIMYHGEVMGSFDCANTIKQSMLSINVPAVNNSDTLRELRIGTITERYDILEWIHKGLVPAVTVPDVFHGELRRTQKLLGKVRVAQTRSVPKSCDMNSALSSFYSGDCHPRGGKPKAYGTSKLDYASAFEPFNIGDKPNQFVAWLDIGRPAATIDELFQSLLDFEWLDDNSQDVVIEAMWLNLEKNVYSKMTITFMMHRGGWIEQTIDVSPMRGDVHYHWAVVWLDMMWVMIMFFLVWQAILHAIDEIKKGLFWWWVTDIFVWIDFFSIIGGFCIAMYFWYISLRIDLFVTRCAGLGSMPAENGIEAKTVWKTRYILWNWNYEKDVQAITDDFSSIVSMQDWHRCLCLLYNLCIVCRFYRGFTGQPRIAVILQTTNAIAMFLVHYLIVFIIVMANFILSGYILFGEQLDDWSTLGKACCSGALMLFGRFDYTRFHKVAPVNAAMWFSSFFILVCLVLTGLTTSTVLHHYIKVRRKTGQAGQSIVKQVWGMINDACYARTYDGAQKSLPPDRLFEMVTMDTDPLRLRHLGRFNVDRRMRTRHDVHEAEIDPKVDVDFLINRGMDEVTAERLLERISEDGHHIEQRSSPVHRLTLFIARQMSSLRFNAEHMRKKTTDKVTWAGKSQDRLDLKHAKCLGLARRIKRAQVLPPGWTQHFHPDGSRYLRQEETGLTSWTLPRHLI